MKKSSLFLVLTSGFASQASAVVLWSLDFDTTTGHFFKNGATGGIVSAPAGFTSATGNVLEFTGNGNPFANFQSPIATQNYLLPAGSVALTDTFTLTYDLYIPNDFAADTKFSGVTLRWNTFADPAGNPANHQGNFPTNFGLGGNATASGEYARSLSNVIPTDSRPGGTSTQTPTAVYPFFLIDSDPTSPQTVYIDNIELSVTESVPEPSAALLLSFAGLGLLARRRR